MRVLLQEGENLLRADAVLERPVARAEVEFRQDGKGEQRRPEPGGQSNGMDPPSLLA